MISMSERYEIIQFSESGKQDGKTLLLLPGTAIEIMRHGEDSIPDYMIRLMKEEA